MKKFLSYLLITIALNTFFNSCVSDHDEDNNFKSYNWAFSSPAEQGLNPGLISTAFNEAAAKGFINSIIVIRNGKIAAESYFNGNNEFSYQTIRSVSKSFLSALLSIAVEKGILRLDQKLVDFFPEYKSYITDSRVNNITIDNLIKMRAGFKGDQEFYFTFTSSSDWVKTILSSTLNFNPGTKTGYSTAGTHLLSAILTKASGMSTQDFANKNLFEPCSISIRNWLKDPQGYYFGGNDMYLTTRDMAVLGLIYLNKGILDGKRIVSEDWVNKSLVSYTGTESGPWGKLNKIGYGYLWWLGEVSGYKIFTALGHGGQYVFCVPTLNMIVAVQSYPNSDWDQADLQERAVLDIIADYILVSTQ